MKAKLMKAWYSSGFGTWGDRCDCFRVGSRGEAIQEARMSKTTAATA